MRMPPIVLLPALLLAGASPTTELRKCVGSGGAVSYQSLPCAEGSREAWVQPVKADPPPPPRSQAPARARTQARASRAPRAKGSRGDTARELRRKRCDKARAKADATRDKLWNRLSFQERSELDAEVARACAR